MPTYNRTKPTVIDRRGHLAYITADRYRQIQSGQPMTPEEDQHLSWMCDRQHTRIEEYPYTYTVTDLHTRENLHGKLTFTGTCDVECDNCHRVTKSRITQIRNQGWRCIQCVSKIINHGTSSGYTGRFGNPPCRCDLCREWKRDYDAKAKARQRQVLRERNQLRAMVSTKIGVPDRIAPDFEITEWKTTGPAVYTATTLEVYTADGKRLRPGISIDVFADGRVVRRDPQDKDES